MAKKTARPKRKNPVAQALANMRSKKVPKARRIEIAKKAANIRWGNS